MKCIINKCRICTLHKFSLIWDFWIEECVTDNCWLNNIKSFKDVQQDEVLSFPVLVADSQLFRDHRTSRSSGTNLCRSLLKMCDNTYCSDFLALSPAVLWDMPLQRPESICNPSSCCPEVYTKQWRLGLSSRLKMGWLVLYNLCFVAFYFENIW